MRTAEYGPPGRLQELDDLNLDEVIDSLRSYLDNFLISADAGMAYLDRLLRERNLSRRADVFPWLGRLAHKVASQAPFHPRYAETAARLAPAKWGRFAGYLSGLRVESQLLEMDRAWSDALLREKRRSRLADLLRSDPENAALAAQLLLLDYMEASSPGDWIKLFKAPEAVAGLWQAMLFRHHAALGMVEPALRLLTTWQEDVLGELDLALAAQVLFKAGEKDRALVLMRRSLELDPLQGPVRRRLDELSDPANKIPDVLEGVRIGLCLPTRDAAPVLRETLAHLAECELGGASIRILLNGCSDDSRDVAESARELFPGREYDVVELPVNVGEAAARNWLIREEMDRGADLVAFADDCGKPDKDWLPWLATTLRLTPKAGAVGLKVVSPGEPALLRRTHRGLSAAKPGLLRLHPPSPVGVYDTGLYSYIRPTASVARRCCLLSREALEAAPAYDIRISSVQACDAAHNLELRLAGFEVAYCGLASCVRGRPRQIHWAPPTDEALGDALGDDVKFTYKFCKDLQRLRDLEGLSCVD